MYIQSVSSLLTDADQDWTWLWKENLFLMKELKKQLDVKLELVVAEVPLGGKGMIHPTDQSVGGMMFYTERQYKFALYSCCLFNIPGCQWAGRLYSSIGFLWVLHQYSDELWFVRYFIERWSLSPLGVSHGSLLLTGWCQPLLRSPSPAHVI